MASLNLRSAGRDAIDRAIALFERAVQLDPRYAAAWAALGGAYTLKGGFLGMRQLQDKAIAPLRRALELNPSLASAHVWLGSALAAQGKLDDALASLHRAVEIEPDNADAHQTLARAYWLSKGMVPEGIAELRTALALNPEAGYTPPPAVDARGAQRQPRGGGSVAPDRRSSCRSGRCRARKVC